MSAVAVASQEILKQRILQVLARVRHKTRFLSAWPAMQCSATHILSALEAEGLIERHADPDGDSFSITNAGRAAMMEQSS